jgi:hypothetical protein
MEIASSIVEDVVRLPEYAPGNVICQFEHALSIATTSTVDNRENVRAIRGEVLTGERCGDGVPLTAQTEDDVLDVVFSLGMMLIKKWSPTYEEYVQACGIILGGPTIPD